MTIIGSSSLMTRKCSGRGRSRALRPNMNRLLNRLAPELMPTATTVRPSTNGLTPSDRASRVAPRAPNSAPMMGHTKPQTRSTLPAICPDSAFRSVAGAPPARRPVGD